MKIQMDVIDGEARFNVTEFLSSMDAEEKLALVETIALNREVFDIVAAVLIGERGGWWGTGSGPQPHEEARLKILAHADAAAFTLCKELVRSRDESKAEERRHRDWAWAMYHAWDNGSGAWTRRPELPAWANTPAPPDERVRAIMADTFKARMAAKDAKGAEVPA